MAKKVTVIKAAKAQKHTQEERRLKVCGYARVSTGSQAQATSYTAQVEYYTEKIESNPLWEFAGVYADEGISGTNVKHRDEFQMMISDCEDGNIDLILTKSITRFARNTVECIQTIRKLKEIGVGIYFEKENINTLSEKSELFIQSLQETSFYHVLQIRKYFLIIVFRNSPGYFYQSVFKRLCFICPSINLLQLFDYIIFMFFMHFPSFRVTSNAPCGMNV